MGAVWAIIQPLTLIALYSFIFSFFLAPRGSAPDGVSYVQFLVAALLPWLALNEGITRSATAVVDNSAIVRRLPLQSELLVVVPNASAVILEVIALLLAYIFIFAPRGISPHLWALPVALAAQFAIQLGVGWLVAAIYVVFRDLGQILGFLLTVIFYISPILYPASDRFAWMFAWNPITPLAGLFRSAMIATPLPPTGSIVFLFVVAGSIFAGGFLFFRRAKASLVDWL